MRARSTASAPAFGPTIDRAGSGVRNVSTNATHPTSSIAATPHSSRRPMKVSTAASPRHTARPRRAPRVQRVLERITQEQEAQHGHRDRRARQQRQARVGGPPLGAVHEQRAPGARSTLAHRRQGSSGSPPAATRPPRRPRPGWPTAPQGAGGWCCRMLTGVAPTASAAWTKPDAATTDARARTIRAVGIQSTSPTTRITVARLGVTTAAKASASSSGGNASARSASPISAAPHRHPDRP